MTDTTDVVQRARQALDAWPGQPITDDDRRVNAVIGSITVAQYDLVRDLLGLVEVALPTITAQRDDALAEVADLLKVDHQCAAVDEAWAADRAERDELRAEVAGWEAVAEDNADTISKLDDEVEKLRATIERVQAQADRWAQWNSALIAGGAGGLASVPLGDVVHDLRRALDGGDQ